MAVRIWDYCVGNYTKESMPYTDFRGRVTQFACTLPAQLQPCT